MRLDDQIHPGLVRHLRRRDKRLRSLILASPHQRDGRAQGEKHDRPHESAKIKPESVHFRYSLAMLRTDNQALFLNGMLSRPILEKPRSISKKKINGPSMGGWASRKWVANFVQRSP